MAVDTKTILEAMNWRSAVKVFKQDQKVSQDLIDTILEAGRLAPSAYGLQPVKIVDISDNRELRAKVQEAAFGQRQVIEAPHLFVVTTLKNVDENFVHDFVVRTSETRHIPLENLTGFEATMKGDILSRDEAGKFAWAGRQAYIAFGAMITAAAMLGVDGGPMEGFNPQKVDEVLELDKDNLRSLGLFALGYRDEADEWSKMPKVRLDKESFILKK